jgi:cellulose synthase operon protein C
MRRMPPTHPPLLSDAANPSLRRKTTAMKHLRLSIGQAILGSLVWGLFVASTPAQVSPEQAAELMLNSARKAYNEKNYPFAAARYREFVGKFGGHKEVQSARYGLALALLEGADKNYNEARDLLQAPARDKNFSEQALAQYYLALAVRGQGLKELAEIENRPPGEAATRRANAQRHFEEALPLVTTALASLAARVKPPAAGAKELSLDAEWAARARCDLAEIQLRLLKAKEAQATAAPFLSEPQWSLSRYRNLGRYYHGYASLLLKDFRTAQKSLALLAPFEDPAFGGHAHYLLARAHHEADERTEAAAHYQAALTGYQKSKEEAPKLLKQVEKFKNEPEERERLVALVRNSAPDYVLRAGFYLAVLQYEAGKFGDALARFQEFVKRSPQSSLRSDAELRIGYCQVQLKQYADAMKTLTQLIERDRKRPDQVLFWLGKAQAGAASEILANAAGHQQALQTALTTLRQAAYRAQEQAAKDPEALARRREILLEIADQAQQAKLYKEAIRLYNQLLSEKALPERQEEIALRYLSALHLDGAYAESDRACERFVEKFPQSTLLPAVLFIYAENSYFRIPAAEKIWAAADRAKEVAKVYGEAVKRYQKVIEKYPEYAKINVARYSLGLAHYRQGELDKAVKALSEIPGPERAGDLVLVPYLIADCLLRQVPTTTPEDALAAGKMEEQLKTAAEMLESFVAAQPKHAQAPDALLKYGLAEQRLAALLVQPPDKAKALTAARGAYERLTRDFAKDPLVPQALLERAKCLAQAGDINQALQELRKFTTEPLRTARIAPMAVLELATFLRGQHKPDEAAALLAKTREQHEGSLAKDAEYAPWISLLRYHQAVALREAKKLPEARQLFDTIVKSAPAQPEAAEAALGVGQCLKEEGQHQLEQARKLRGSGKKDEQAQAARLKEEGYKSLRSALISLEAHAERLKKQDNQQDVRARMLYEAAWCLRALAEPEIEKARAALGVEIAKKLGPAAAKFPAPEVPLDKVPMQPSEKQAVALYEALVASFPDQPLATEARFELAELLAQRQGYDQAVKLLTDVLDKEPAAELTEKVRLRLGAIQAAKGNLKAALGQFDAVARNPKSPLLGWAQYRAGEALLQAEQYPEAVKRLALFRDQAPFQNMPGLTDRALLRLGHAHALEKQWDQSRQALERLVSAFSGSPWAHEARYGIGWAFQQQRNYDAAINAYNQVTTHTATEVAARAQMQIGLCRLEQKRYADAANALLVVPFTYDYPELTAAALLEAARAYGELGQRDQVQRLLERLVRDYPGTPWAEAAKERLGPPRAN